MSKDTKYQIQNTKYSLTIGWLYPTLMSTYGDRGNIIVLQKRCEWRGITVEIKRLDVGFDHKQLAICNLLFMGGAQDKQQSLVSEDLKKKIKVLSEMIQGGVPGLYICGAYQFLGKYYKEADGSVIDGLGIFDLYTENPGPNHSRLIGNLATQTNILNTKYQIQNTIVGFENHGGRTYLGKDIKPFAAVTSGFGNNGKDGTEGAIYKNSIGSYMHGPILPKNPHIADFLIKLALKKKYPSAGSGQVKKIELKRLDDALEWQAHEAILEKIKKS